MKFLVFILLFAVLPVHAQVRPKVPNPRSNSLLNERVEVPQFPEVRAVFQRIERGIMTGSAETFKADLGKQVSMTMSGGENGYYSSGQAFLILQNFFSTRKPSQFEFSRINDNAANPFATGGLSFIRKGTRESVQVYVSLARQDSAWAITQFNIY